MKTVFQVGNRVARKLMDLLVVPDVRVQVWKIVGFTSVFEEPIVFGLLSPNIDSQNQSTGRDDAGSEQ